MSGNDIMEMDSMTEEIEGDFEAGMIEEEVGKRSRLKRLFSLVCGCLGCSANSLNVISTI